LGDEVCCTSDGYVCWAESGSVYWEWVLKFDGECGIIEDCGWGGTLEDEVLVIGSLGFLEAGLFFGRIHPFSYLGHLSFFFPSLSFSVFLDFFIFISLGSPGVGF